MVWAAWITATAGLVTAVTNGIAWVRHGRKDDGRFAAHGAAIAEIQTSLNGHTVPGPEE